MKTAVPKQSEATEKWYLIDAADAVLGRLATKAATLLRGKHQTTFAPHVAGKNHVVIINAAKVAVTGNKLADKRYYRHSQKPGSLKSRTLAEELERHPERPIEHAVRGMLPDNKLRSVWFNQLHVYAGAEHPHQAQQAETVELREAKRG